MTNQYNDFWDLYFNNLHKSIKENIAISILVIVSFIFSPLLFKSIYDDIYHGDVVGTIVSKDPKVYSHKHKKHIHYNYYANVFFPSVNLTKYVEVSENIHKNGLQGQSYYFRKGKVLKTPYSDWLLFLRSIHSSIFIVSTICIILHLFSFKSKYSTLKKIK